MERSLTTTHPPALVREAMQRHREILRQVQRQAAGLEQTDALAPAVGVWHGLTVAALLWIAVLAVGLLVSVLA